MLLTKEVEVKLSGSTIQYYENLGYEIPRIQRTYIKNGREYKRKPSVQRGTTIIVDVNDLFQGSETKIDVLCDICNIQVSHISYNQYIRQHAKGYDCCTKCASIDREKTCRDKYGVDHPAQNKEIQEKIKQTNREKYGYDYTVQVPEVQEKIKKSLYMNDTVPQSSQQRNIYKMLKDYYGQNNVLFNFPFLNYYLDIVLIINNLRINIEYDCWYWHQNQQKDRDRDEFIKSQGYKVLRIKSSTKIPKFTDLVNAIEFLKNNNKNYSEIILPDWKTKQNDSEERSEINNVNFS